MEAAQLKAVVREKGKSNNNRLRKEGYVPAIFYGKEIGSRKIAVKSNELEKLIGQHGYSALVKLIIEDNGNEETHTSLIREVQRHPVKDEFTHLDFYQISMKDKLDTTVFVQLIGEAKGLKDGGIIQHGAREIEIRCLPTNIPEFIEVDVSDLCIGDTLTVKDLNLGDDIEIISEEDMLLATIIPPALENDVEEENETEEVE